jgi:hypothetical protein
MWLDSDLDRAASNHPTKYTKLILESAQCLCSALHINGLGDVSPYGKGYINHPISRWCSHSRENWMQALDYMSALHDHYYGWTYDEVRSLDDDVAWDLYDGGHFHKSVVQIATSGVEHLVETVFPSLGKTARPKCVIDSCEEATVVETYRKYFACIKSQYSWFEWSDGEPEWLDRYREKYRKVYRKGQFLVAEDEG